MQILKRDYTGSAFELPIGLGPIRQRIQRMERIEGFSGAGTESYSPILYGYIIVHIGGNAVAVRFSKEILEVIHREKIIGLRAGLAPHRFIGLWVVVAEGRVFVRSWSLSRGGWHDTLLKKPVSEIQVGLKNTVVLKVRSVQTRSERLKDAVSAAYKEKYNTPGSAKYVKDLCGKKSRGTTTELVPR